MSVDFTLNGQPVSVSAPPDTPLLWALRNELKITGVKFGCGAGICGACTIMADGDQLRSCQTSLRDVAGKHVLTIEGLPQYAPSPAVATAVVNAWIKAQAPQCGYCQPGFVVATTSVIASAPGQSSEQVLSQLTNICRCGSYDAIRTAVTYALEALNAETPPPAQNNAVQEKRP